MNNPSRHNLSFSFYHWTPADTRADIYQKADAMIDAAIAGGMKRDDAINMISEIWLSGWSEGVDTTQAHCDC